MAKVKDLLVNGSSRFIGKIYASDQFISQVANGTAPFVVSSSTVVANLNADMTDGLHVHTGRNNEVNKIVRTDANGYIQTGYINTNVGTENLAISRIFYEYNNDGYIRKMSPSSFFSVLENSGNDISITVAGQNRKLTVGYATSGDHLTKLTKVSRVAKNSSNTEIETVTGWYTDLGFLQIQRFCPPSMYRTTGDMPAPYGIGFGNGVESGGIIPIGQGDKLEEIRFYGANSGPTLFTFGRQIWESTSYDSRNSNTYTAYLSINSTNGNLITSGTITAPSFIGSLSGTASNADTLDGYHEYSFLRYRDVASTDGTSTLWSQIGIRSYHNALPEGLSGLYNYGQVVSLPGNGSRLDIFTNHFGSSNSNSNGGLWWRSGWG